MNKIRGLRDIINSMNHVRSGLRTQVQYDEYEIFNELAQLGRERARLRREKENWQGKVDRIDMRLREIEELEGSLQGRIAMKEKSALDVRYSTARKEGREVVIKY